MVIHSYHRFSTVPFHKRTFCGKTDDNLKNGTKTSPQILPQARVMYKNRIKIQKCEGRIPPALRKLAALCTGFFMAGRYRRPAVGEALHSWDSGFESVPSSPAHGGPASSSNPAIRRGARQQRGRAGHRPPGAAVRRGPGCPPRRMPRERPRPGEPPQIASRARQRARREAGKQTTREAPPIPWASAARARRPP